ncbi:cancer-associated gene 1 protein homolog [Anopheles aquasalis]|uniref:cancer-associated gene 1 protein homolog n=1 Tax=Anopheles aquasalis TaxID=42839 RepID=UPI00215A0DB2|nr:cancer-associated gene 1 protein homolog [Anopheles aquasalis]
MYRAVWCIFVSLIAVAKQVSSDHKVVHPNILSSKGVSGYALELLLTKHDFISRQLQELREDVQEQRKSISENQEQLRQTLELLGKMQQEMLKQRKEAMNDRQQVSMWQAEVQTSIKANQIESARVLKEVLQNIATNRALQEGSIELLNNLQEEIKQQKEDETKWHTASQQAITEIRSNQEQSYGLVILVQEEMQRQLKDIAKDAEKHSKWQAELHTSIRTIQNVTSIQQQLIAGIRNNQDPSFDLLNQTQKEVQTQPKEIPKHQENHLKEQAELQAPIRTKKMKQQTFLRHCEQDELVGLLFNITSTDYLASIT